MSERLFRIRYRGRWGWEEKIRIVDDEIDTPVRALSASIAGIRGYHGRKAEIIVTEYGYPTNVTAEFVKGAE